MSSSTNFEHVYPEEAGPRASDKGQHQTGYHSIQITLEVKFSTDYVRFLSKSSVITPFFTASTADTGAQVIILGHNHLESIGLNISCLHKTLTVLDFANLTATGAMGVFY